MLVNYFKINTLQSQNSCESKKISFKNNLFLKSQDVFAKNTNQVSFGSLNSNNAQQYINDVRASLKKKGETLNSLNQLDPIKLEGILDDIDIFKNLSVKDLYLMQGLSTLLLQRGCPNGCSHCMVNAKLPIQNMCWEDFKNIAEGIGEVKKRLGFNPFYINKSYITKSNSPPQEEYLKTFYPYYDAEPMITKLIDKQGQSHNIASVVSTFFEETGNPFGIITAGWEPNDEYTQKAAAELVNLVQTNPKVIKKLGISLHPFHKLIESGHRQEYIDRMANTIKTLLPLLKDQKARIIPIYEEESQSGSGYSYQDSIKLTQDVLNKVVLDCKKEGRKEEDYSFLTNIKNVQDNKDYFNIHETTYQGRAAKKFNKEKNEVAFCLDKNSAKVRIITEGNNTDDWSNMDISESIVNNTLSNNDFIDRLIISINPANSYEMQAAKRFHDQGNIVKAELYRKKYINNMTVTINSFLPLFEINKALINIKYSPESGYSKKDLENLTTEILHNLKQSKNLNISQYEFLTKDPIPNSKLFSFEKAPEIQVINTNKELPIDAFKDIFYALSPENRYNFIKDFPKAINVDGDLLVVVSDRGGEIDKQYIKLDNIKLNIQKTCKKYKHDNFKVLNIP